MGRVTALGAPVRSVSVRVLLGAWVLSDCQALRQAGSTQRRWWQECMCRALTGQLASADPIQADSSNLKAKQSQGDRQPLQPRSSPPPPLFSSSLSLSGRDHSLNIPIPLMHLLQRPPTSTLPHLSSSCSASACG